MWGSWSAEEQDVALTSPHRVALPDPILHGCPFGYLPSEQGCKEFGTSRSDPLFHIRAKGAASLSTSSASYRTLTRQHRAADIALLAKTVKSAMSSLPVRIAFPIWQQRRQTLNLPDALPSI